MNAKRKAFLLTTFAFLVAASSTSSFCAQHDLLRELFPGVSFPRHLRDSGADQVLVSQARIESSGKVYVALTYYEPYRDAPDLRYVSFALLELTGTEYKLALDYMASDGAGSGLEFPTPFLYTVDAQDLVAFPMCYRGCGYSFFRLDPKPVPVTVQRYDGLDDGETYSGRGDEYRFDESGLSATFRIMRPGDAMCCLTGGTLEVVYELRGNQFRVSRVKRNKLAQEGQ